MLDENTSRAISIIYQVSMSLLNVHQLIGGRERQQQAYGTLRRKGLILQMPDGVTLS